MNVNIVSTQPQGRSQDFLKGGSKFSRCLLSRLWQKFFAKGSIWLLSIVHTFHCIILNAILHGANTAAVPEA